MKNDSVMTSPLQPLSKGEGELREVHTKPSTSGFVIPLLRRATEGEV